MPYATYSQMREEYGDQGMIDMTPGSSSATVEARWTRLLAGRSAYIDTFIAKQGYSLPIDFDSLNADVATNLRALLAGLCIVLAMEEGSPALIAVAEGQKSQADHARATLRAIASGEMRLPLGIGTEIIAAANGFFKRGDGDPIGPFDDRLFDWWSSPCLTQ